MSAICHDLRSALSSIVMGAELLERSLAKLDGMAAEKRVTGGLVRSAERLTSLVSNLDDLARIERGALAVDLQRVDLASLLHDAATARAPRWARRGVTVIAADAQAASIDCDRERVVQALAELVDNAVRSSPDGGHVLIDVSVADERATFSVTDAGPGMSEAALRHAFDASWHASQSPRDGTGLGLAIVRGIAVAHGGGATVELGRARGARVSFWVPAR
jgi:signal transduction histidine kinase